MSTLPTQNNLICLEGMIVRINNGSKPTWCSGLIQTSTDEKKSFKGKFLLAEGDAVKLYGRWVDNPGWGDGKQFDVASFEYNLLPTEESWIVILSKSPKFSGIGPARAKKIAKAIAELGDQFEEVLFNQAGKLQDYGLSTTVINTLQSQWRENKKNNIILTELVAYGLSYGKAARLLEEKGEQIISVIRENPYKLIELIDGFGFITVDQVALKMGFAKDGAFRIQAAISFAINEVLGFGNCWIEFNKFIAQLQSDKVLSLPGEENKGKIQQQIAACVADNKIVVVPIEEKAITVVAPKWLYDAEMRIIDIFNNNIYELPNQKLQDILNNIREGNFQLNEKQKLAASTMLKYNISFTSGYAGTGKTSGLKRVLEVAEIARLRVALAAPTGKAAKQIERATGYEAKTIHRLLEYGGNGFTRNKFNPIEADIITVDEASMISVELLDSLLQAIDFNKSRLIFLGDHNQLPSVGAGSVLRDVINRKAAPIVILDKVMRNAGDLRLNAEAIIEQSKLNGNSNTICPNPRPNISRNGLKQWYVADHHKEPAENENIQLLPKEDILETLKVQFEEKLHKYNFNILKDIQVLSPTHVGRLGTRNVNKVLQQVIQKKLYNRDVVINPKGKAEILVGDKVIQRKNNYDLDIMNGSQGIVIDIEYDDKNQPKTYIIDFGMGNEEKIIEMPSIDTDYLELAYIIGVHQSQGSEWPLVIVVITDKTGYFLKNKNLLYTAVTRARESVIILTDQEGAKFAARNPEQEKRLTFAQFYLKPFAGRSNVHIMPESLTTSAVEATTQKESFPVSNAQFPESELDEGEFITDEQQDFNEQVALVNQYINAVAESEIENQELSKNKLCLACQTQQSIHTIIDNEQAILLCNDCFNSYKVDHNLDTITNPIDTTISSNTSISTVSPTANTIDTPTDVITTLPQPPPTGLQPEELRERKELMAYGQEEEIATQSQDNPNPEIIPTTNSVSDDNSNLVIENGLAQVIESKNSPSIPKRVIKTEVTRNLFTDNLADKFPFWITEVVEKEVDEGEEIKV